jgi:hypothetical protein
MALCLIASERTKGGAEKSPAVRHWWWSGTVSKLWFGEDLRLGLWWKRQKGKAADREVKSHAEEKSRKSHEAKSRQAGLEFER